MSDTPMIDELIEYLKREIDRHMAAPEWFDRLSSVEQGEWFADQRRACDRLAYEVWRMERLKRQMDLELAMITPRSHFISRDQP